MEHKKQFWAPFWLKIFTAAAITLIAVCIAPLWTRNASSEPITNPPTVTPKTDELGVIVTNETSTNIIVFSTAGAQGCTVPPGRFCFVPRPPGWIYIGIKVVRCGRDGDMEDPDDSVTFGFQMNRVKLYRVKPREF